MIVLFGFRWFVHGGGARQRQYWHLMPLLKRVGKIWQIVWQGPRFGFVAETGGALLLSTPGVRFHAFLPCFLLFFFLRPYRGMFFFLVLLRPCSSHRLLFSKYVFFLCRLYPASSQGSFCFLFFILFVFVVLVVVGVFCQSLVPGTLAFDWPTLINPRFFLVFSVSQSVAT